MPKPSAHPHCVWRAGRPRFSPGPALRAAGHQGRDLKHEDGSWFSFGEMADFSRAFAKRLGEAPKPARGRPPAGRPSPLTVAAMVGEWQQSQRWTGGALRGRKALAANTVRDYRQKLKVLADDFPQVWAAPAAAVTIPVMQKVYDGLETARGLATARGVIAVMQSAFKWAITRGRVRGVNPCSGLDKAMPQPRIRFGTRREVLAMVAAADAIGLPAIGDSVLTGVWTGQRQNDRLALLAHSRLAGRRVFRQHKTGAMVAILEAPELEARLIKARQRRLAAGIADPHVILNEATWRPYLADTYRHDFARVRAAAAAGLPSPQRGEGGGRRLPDEGALAPCPSCASLRDQDLRDTAVTWMALAGSTIPEICAVTGHSPETAHQILKHYLARHPEMSDSAIRKMVAWYEGNGETETGL